MSGALPSQRWVRVQPGPRHKAHDPDCPWIQHRIEKLVLLRASDLPDRTPPCSQCKPYAERA